MYSVYFSSPVGIIKILGTEAIISEIQFVDNEEQSNPNALLQETVKQLEEYFAGKRRQFDLPVKQSGTPFQQSVWKALTEIPYGETTTYGALAKKLENEKAVRAVGAANGQNKIPIIVPCHRVTGHDGKLVGYAYGMERKRYLLNLEKNHSTVTAQLSLYG